MFHRFGKPLVIDMKEVELFDVVLSQLDQVMPGLSKELLSKELLRKERYVATMETYRSFIQCVCVYFNLCAEYLILQWTMPNEKS